MKALLTPSQVCILLQISKATLSRMVKAGEIPYVLRRQGKRKKMVGFEEDILEKWVAVHRRGSQSLSRSKSAISLVNVVATSAKDSSNSADFQDEHRFEQPAVDAREHA